MPDGMLNLTQGESAFAMPSLARKGRGAASNPPVRFEAARREAFDDGWATLEQSFAALPPLPTSLTEDHAKSALSYNESPDLGFDRSINPYRGCEHGCVYCYARPSHAYLGLSPGLDFETRLMFKPDIAALLERNSASPATSPAPSRLAPIRIPISRWNANWA